MAVSQKVERLVSRATGPRTEALHLELERLSAAVTELQAAWTESQGGVQTELSRLEARMAEVRRIAAASLDDIPHLREQLIAARKTEAYEQAFMDPAPLVTIRIPTYVRSELLVERALPSIVRQSYQNFEVMVIGDGCTNDVAKRIEDFGDPRVRFVNLPYRYPYPARRDHQWFVAGAPGVNVGTEMANGSWLAMLSDDDEFEPHHLECLLEKARTTRSEMVYGDILQRQPLPEGDRVLTGYPPEFGSFGFQSAIFMTALSFYEFSTRSWLLDEPSDWNLCRRMVESGVRIGHVDVVVMVYYPSGSWEPETRGF
jgi:hypothetical protein